MRIQMLSSKAVEKEGGARRVYQAGRFYVLPSKEARGLIAAGVAVDPDAPPPEPAQTPVVESGAGVEDGGADPATGKGDDA